MIYLTQLVYVHEGKERDFEAFEDVVLPLLASYRGELVLRLRPPPASFVAGTEEAPYEVHVVRFESEADLAAYSSDETRQQALPLKDASVKRVVLLRGTLA
jgi:hypothetical protein